jgi:subtilisin family serine protease
MAKGDYLHEMGFMGEGMVIAVLDAGFENVNNISAFDSLRMNNRILGTWDFVDGKEDVYTVGGHGRNVLSIIAGNLPGTFMGSAPRASYYLFRTEEGASEYKIEEANWIAAAERADSLGADMITSSLGYSDFNDTSTSYTYADMDGNTTICTRGADFAARKGMLMVNSAGNEGTSSWHYLTAPSDADSVMTIGAVTPDGEVSSFSSRGPSADGRIKPNISGQGQATAFIDVSGNVATGSGTSYSTPLLAGLTACLWQSSKEKSNMEIIQIIQQTASAADNPNDSIGYGIPDFQAAHLKLLVDKGALYQMENLPVAYPNPFTTGLNVMLYAPEQGLYQVDVFDSKGQKIYNELRMVDANRFSRIDLSLLDAAQPGMYVIRIYSNDHNQMLKVVKM